MVILLCVAIIVSYLDRGVIAVLVPFLKAEFQLSDVQIGLLQGLSFSAFFAIASLPVGRLVDRMNRRNIIIGGILIWSASTMMCGMVGSFWQLFVARAGVGIGEACLLPAAYSMVADSFTAARRGRAMSILTIATSIGGGASALLGGILLTIWSGANLIPLPFVGPVATWRAVFLVAGTPGFMVAVFMLAVREPRRAAPAADVPAEASDFARHAIRNWRLFVPVYVAFSSLFFFSYAIALWSPAVLTRTYGFTPGTAGMAAGSFQLVGSIAGAVLAGILGDIMIARQRKYGRLRLWMVGLVPAITGALLVALPGAYFYLLGMGMAIFAAGILTTTSYPALYDMVSPGMRGRSLALYLFLGNICGLGGGTLAVAFITENVFGDERLVHFSVALAAMGAMTICVVMTLIMKGRYETARLAHHTANARSAVTQA
jgi:MFS family permease